MTYEELNEVWALKKAITKKQQKIAALRDSAETITPKYIREQHGKKSYPALDVSPKSKNIDSRVEDNTSKIIDTEAEIVKLQERLIKAVPELTDKILAEVKDDTEQTLLIYRYVSCKYFRDIGFLLEMSEARVYFLHRQILKKILRD